jgi:hypothetical protein
MEKSLQNGKIGNYIEINFSWISRIHTGGFLLDFYDPIVRFLSQGVQD